MRFSPCEHVEKALNWFERELLLKPLLLDALGLEDDKGVQRDADRRDTLYYRGPSTGIYCLNRYGVWALLRGAYNKSINALALHDTALVGIVPAPRGDPADRFVQVKQVPDIF